MTMKKLWIGGLLVFVILLSACSGKKEEKTMYLNLPKEEITEFELVPFPAYHKNGAKTSDKKVIDEIIDRLNQIEFRYRGTEEKEEMLGYELNCTFTITLRDRSQQHYLIDNNEMRMPDGGWWEMTGDWMPDARYFADLLGIERNAKMSRINVYDKTPVKLEYVSLTEGGEGGITEDKDLLKTVLVEISTYDYYECQGYKSDYDEPEGYFEITYEDGFVRKYEVAGYYVRCEDGTWLEPINWHFQISSYLSQKLGFEYREPAAG